MKQVAIDNSIINSPFEAPARHFRCDDFGITDEIVPGRRPSSYFIPIAQSKKKGKQLAFETEWTQDRIEESKFINQVRERVSLWRQGGYAGPLTPISRRLLEYWTREDRYPRLYFCQVEALETAIYLTKIAKSSGDVWIENALIRANAQSNPLFYRIAFKMATGSGKTAVMAMLFAWHAINKAVAPTDARFSDSFLIVSPGITIRDRLRVLLPSDTENSYRKLDLVPYELMDELGRAKIVITNFHAFKQREKIAAGKLTKAILSEAAGAAPHAAGVHRRLQQPERLEPGRPPRLWMGEEPVRGNERDRAWAARSLQQRARRKVARAAAHDPRRQPAARVGSRAATPRRSPMRICSAR
jgi:type III restriction enzyme